MKVTKIIGLGMASLLAKCYFKDAKLIVRESELRAFNPNEYHTAVLRFKSDLISKISGIEMPHVIVRKEVVNAYNNKIDLSIAAINAYSLKVNGCLVERSIIDADKIVSRYVPKDDFISRLWSSIDKKDIIAIDDYNEEEELDFNNFCEKDEAVISTIPLWKWYKELRNDGVDYNIKPIRVVVYKIPNCDLHQTIYFPFHNGVYRATIEYDRMIVEVVNELNDNINSISFTDEPDRLLFEVCKAFGIFNWSNFKLISDHIYHLGKMNTFNIDNNRRKALILDLTLKKNVYSLGRYATMRNIGMDNIAEDILKIDKLIKIDNYSSRMYSI